MDTFKPVWKRLKVKAGMKYYLDTFWTDLYFRIISERELTAFAVAWSTYFWAICALKNL